MTATSKPKRAKDTPKAKPTANHEPIVNPTMRSKRIDITKTKITGIKRYKGIILTP